MRRSIVTGLVAVTSLGASLSAHIAGALAHTEIADADGGVHARPNLVPAFLATALVVLAGLWFMRRVRGHALVVALAACPLVAFVAQERLERLLSVESSPFGAGREPSLASAAMASLPWIVVAFLLIRSFVALARTAAARSAMSSVFLIRPAIGSALAPVDVDGPGVPHDPILDRPPRAPPRLLRLAAV